MTHLIKIYDIINDWIKTADQKAMIFASLNVLGFFGYLITLDFSNLQTWYEWGALILFVISGLTALILLVLVVYPRLDNKLKKSKIYFCHIANKYKNDLETGVSDYCKLKAKDLEKDYASQIVINSTIAKKKYTYLKYFAFTFISEIVLGVLLTFLVKL
ncbi:Pycsar system effector family protein [Patescibacteria group bacterium]